MVSDAKFTTILSDILETHSFLPNRMLYSIRYFLFSKHKETYRKIGSQYSVSAIRVYRLAHGKRPSTKTDSSIIDELLKMRIVKAVKIRMW